MKQLRRHIRSMLLEMTEGSHSFLDALHNSYEKAPYAISDTLFLEFPDGCQVHFRFKHVGVQEVWLDFIETLNEDGDEDEVCFKQGYARETMNQVLEIADNHRVFITLHVGAFGAKSTADEEVLKTFYMSLGFESFGEEDMMERTPQ